MMFMFMLVGTALSSRGRKLKRGDPGVRTVFSDHRIIPHKQAHEIMTGKPYPIKDDEAQQQENSLRQNRPAGRDQLTINASNRRRHRLPGNLIIKGDTRVGGIGPLQHWNMTADYMFRHIGHDLDQWIELYLGKTPSTARVTNLLRDVVHYEPPCTLMQGKGYGYNVRRVDVVRSVLKFILRKDSPIDRILSSTKDSSSEKSYDLKKLVETIHDAIHSRGEYREYPPQTHVQLKDDGVITFIKMATKYRYAKAEIDRINEEMKVYTKETMVFNQGVSSTQDYPGDNKEELQDRLEMVFEGDEYALPKPWISTGMKYAIGACVFGVACLSVWNWF